MVRFELAELEIASVDELQLAYHDGTQWTRLPVYWVYQERFADALWFRLPADIPPLSADDGAWIYAGNPDAPPYVGDGISVWEQHDYFDDLGPSWVTEGNVSLIDNSVRLGPGGVLRGLQTWPVDHAVDVALEAPAWPQGLSIGFQRSADFEDSAPLARWTHQGVGFVPEIEIEIAEERRWTGDAAIVADNRVELGVDRLAGGVRFWLRSEVVTERAFTGGDYLEPLQIRVANVGPTEFDLAQLRVRRTMNPLPHVTRAALEPQP